MLGAFQAGLATSNLGEEVFFSGSLPASLFLHCSARFGGGCGILAFHRVVLLSFMHYDTIQFQFGTEEDTLEARGGEESLIFTARKFDFLIDALMFRI